MNAATLPPPAPGQTYQDYLSSVVCAAAERWARDRAARLPEPSPERERRPTLLDFAAEEAAG